MLITYPQPTPIWLDLFNADQAEEAQVATTAGVRIPARDALAEIESSSRLASDGEAIYLSMPIAARNATGLLVSSPLGIIITPKHLVTIRYQELPAFDHFLAGPQARTAQDSAELFAGLLEAVVDRLADVLEHIGGDLDALSRIAFSSDATPGLAPAKADKLLRNALRAVGQAAERTSLVRDSLLGIGRMVPYVLDVGGPWIPSEVQRRCKTIRRDAASLSEYDNQISNKVQFLLDATLGFINIEQNNIIKTLTVVSVVGIPPTLVASIYGMNFKNIPELDWAWGYEYGWAMIILSALVPLVVLKWRGWM